MRYEERSPVTVLLLTLVTCGLFLIYWYYSFYRDLYSITGRSPTGLPFWADLVIAILSAGLWGTYVDFCISRELQRIRQANGIDLPDSTIVVLALDAVSIFTAHLLFIVTSAIQQDEWNKMLLARAGQPFERPVTVVASIEQSPKQTDDSRGGPY